MKQQSLSALAVLAWLAGLAPPAAVVEAAAGAPFRLVVVAQPEPRSPVR